MRLATEGALSGEMSFSGSDESYSESKAAGREEAKTGNGRHTPQSLSRNMSTPKGKLFYKTDVNTPSESPFKESPVTTA